jgi:membrane fusion protein (multidrug efflux system)
MRAARITVIACCLLTVPLIKGCGTGEAGEPLSSAPEVPLPVSVADAWRGEARALHQTTTHLEAVEEATLVTRVAGEVVEILVEEGETVAAGQVLARLDGERLELRLAEVRARLDQVRREYRRNVQLHERGLVSQTAYESVRYDMEALESEYRLASLEFSYAEIKAPFAAVVTERLIKPGNTLPAGTGAFRIADVSTLEASLWVPQREMSKFTAGQSAILTLDALPGETVEGTVLRVSPTVDPGTGSFRVTLAVPNEGLPLRPGMYARARVAWDVHPDAVLIPERALVDDDGEASVWVVREGRAWRRVITPGIVSAGSIEVLDGLDADEIVVVAGQAGLRDGMAIAVAPPAEPDPAVARDDETAARGNNVT